MRQGRKTFEDCAEKSWSAFILLSVGVQNFGPDLSEVMNTLVQTAALKENGPDYLQEVYLMQA